MARVRPILLVHGAWHGAWCWATLQAELDRRGLPSYAVELPGHGLSTHRSGICTATPPTSPRCSPGSMTRSSSSVTATEGAVVTQATGSAHAAADRVAHLVYLDRLRARRRRERVGVRTVTPAPPRRPRRGRARWRRRHLPDRSRQGAGGVLRDVPAGGGRLPPSPGSIPSRSRRSSSRSPGRRGRRSLRRT